MTNEQLRARCDLLAGTDHFTCEDSWYSCPLSEDGCADDRKEKVCDCGLDKRRNIALEALLQVEREAMAAGLERAALHIVANEAVVRMVNDALVDVRKVKKIVGKDDAHACGMQAMGEVILDQLTRRAT